MRLRAHSSKAGGQAGDVSEEDWGGVGDPLLGTCSWSNVLNVLVGVAVVVALKMLGHSAHLCETNSFKFCFVRLWFQLFVWVCDRVSCLAIVVSDSVSCICDDEHSGSTQKVINAY